MARGQHGQCGQLYLRSHTLVDLSTAPTEVEDATQTVKGFVIRLYDRTSTSTDADKARCKLLVNKSNVQLIQPTSAALKQHVRRAVYQGGHIWDQALVPAPALRSRTDWGWIKTSDQMYEPLWTTLSEGSKVCFKEIVSCKCKKGCTKKCKCKNAKPQLKCTALCVCERECSDN
jgi:hypothetical protein